MTTYPVGYGTSRVSFDELKRRFEPKMHPEYARRLFNWIKSKDGLIGIGGGWRDGGAQLDAGGNVKPGFAAEGKSFHQNQTYNDGFTGYCAVDLVATNAGGKHRSPSWSESIPQGSADAKKWGVHCNVGAPPGGEPWHMQPIEIDGHTRWVNAGRPAPKAGYPIPTVGEPSEPSEEPQEPPKGPYGDWPWKAKPLVSKTRRNRHESVWYLQSVIRDRAGGGITVDGHFGSQTERRVKDLQRVFGLAIDGWVGKKTWGAVDYLGRR